MKRRTALALLGLLILVDTQAHADASCPVPDAFTIASGGLAATTASVKNHTLTILALGGASTLGGPAHGVDFTYPARLAARLRQALPGVTVTVATRAVARQPDAALLAQLESSLTEVKPALVIWGPGASAAARGDDLDTFMGTVNDAIGKIRAANSDLILMTLQYAPSVSRVVNLTPYRQAILRGAGDADVPVLDRYELMRFWSDTGFLNLDVTNADDRIHVSRVLYDCLAEILSTAIADAAK